MKKISINFRTIDDEKNVVNRGFSFGKRGTKIFYAFAALISVASVSAVTHYMSLVSTVAHNSYLESENSTLKKRMRNYKQKIEDIDKNLEIVNKFEKKLKSFSNLDTDVLSEPFFSEAEIDKLQTRLASPLRPKNEKMIRDNDFKKFDTHLDNFEQTSSELKNQLKSLTTLYSDKRMLFHSLPTLFPTLGWITSFYGKRKNPVTKRIRLHSGLDIGAAYGAPILAAADGVVVYSGKLSAMGKTVQLDHGYGIQTFYAHAQKLLVSSGERVKRGQIIARVGSTGHSTGPHLHYEVRINGVPADPYYFLIEQ